MSSLKLDVVPTTSKNKSPLNGLTCREFVDPMLVWRLINSEGLLKAMTKDDYKHLVKFGGITEGYTEKQWLQERILPRIKDGVMSVKYQMRGTIGRVFANQSASLGCLRRPVRHTLTHGRYIDIDIDNCHPVILNQVAQAKEIKRLC